jgi:carbamoyltransferase
MVLNTSFNLNGEPIVCTPDDALRTFATCGLDVLYLGNVRVTK